MKIAGKEYKTIWFDNNIVKIIDQTKLPHQFIIKDLKTVKDSINAIKKTTHIESFLKIYFIFKNFSRKRFFRLFD